MSPLEIAILVAGVAAAAYYIGRRSGKKAGGGRGAYRNGGTDNQAER